MTESWQNYAFTARLSWCNHVSQALHEIPVKSHTSGVSCILHNILPLLEQRWLCRFSVSLYMLHMTTCRYCGETCDRVSLCVLVCNYVSLCDTICHYVWVSTKGCVDSCYTVKIKKIENVTTTVCTDKFLWRLYPWEALARLSCYTSETFLRDHCHERPPALTDRTFFGRMVLHHSI